MGTRNGHHGHPTRNGHPTQKRRKIPPPTPASQPAKEGSRSAATAQARSQASSQHSARKLGSAPSKADRATASALASVPSCRGKRVVAEQVCGRESYGTGMRAGPLAIAHLLILVRPVAQVNKFPLLSPTFLLAHLFLLAQVNQPCNRTTYLFYPPVAQVNVRYSRLPSSLQLFPSQQRHLPLLPTLIPFLFCQLTSDPNQSGLFLVLGET
jgi:hypothetical protein